MAELFSSARRRMRALEGLRADLSFNVHEALALDARFLELIGNLT